MCQQTWEIAVQRVSEGNAPLVGTKCCPHNVMSCHSILVEAQVPVPSIWIHPLCSCLSCIRKAVLLTMQ